MRWQIVFDSNLETLGSNREATMLLASQISTDVDFLQGLRSQIGRRVRISYDVDLSESGASRETVEGRLTAVDPLVVLEESRLIHPLFKEDRARRTTSLRSVRRYDVLDQRTGLVVRTLQRLSPSVPPCC